MAGTLRRLIVVVMVIVVSGWCAGFCAGIPAVPAPKAPEDISAEIIQCDPNSCQVSDRLVGSIAGLPGCLVDLSSGDGQKLVRQVDNFRKPGTRLQPSGEVKVMYDSWLDQTHAQSASILGFLKSDVEKNDRVEVKSTMLPGMSVLPEDLDYEKIAAAFQGKPQSEVDRYGIVMSVIIYEVSAAVYNTSNRKIDIDWPCLSLAGGKSLLYKSGEENSKCFIMAVYAPIPFCLQLQTLAKTAPTTKPKPDGVSTLSVGEKSTDTDIDFSRVTESGELISQMLKTYVKAHKPTVSIADPPRAVYARDLSQ